MLALNAGPASYCRNWRISHSRQYKNNALLKSLQPARRMIMRHNLDLHMVLLGAFSLVVLLALAFGS